ncbi:MAG: prephenate dehydrogenase/arogenate dehydrogenase family protein [Candidatus Omnitrophica bacterium]|nr:prephenate dehydrogenase/arogenate dehydrogenase family protein [Candidatus Omnitrophota bacterium]
MRLKKAAIIGVGLIGGSVGKALLDKDICDTVEGVFRSRRSLEKALSRKAVTGGSVRGYQSAITGADVVIIATPVSVVSEVLSRIASCDHTPSLLVTDVGSTKQDIVSSAAAAAPGVSFVGSHPLAGSEKTGVEHSRADLFEGSVCIVTPGENTDPEKVNRISGFWRALGAEVVEMSPEEHDRVIAFSSHLPHAVACALVGSLGEGFPSDMLSTGFRDTSRVAGADGGLWKDIFLSNRANVLEAIDRYQEALGKVRGAIDSADADALKELLNSLKKERDDLFR